MKKGNWDPTRVLEAWGLIGYKPHSAILDICDNAVSAKASMVKVKIESGKSDTQIGTRAIITRILISDNGLGMDEADLDNALSLGSSSAHYSSETLSKFGMGLKAASSSIGRCLTIVSKKRGGQLWTVTLDQDILRNKNEYCYESYRSTADEIELFSKETKQSEQGTIIIISKIRTSRLPKLIEIKTELKKWAAVVYHYYIAGEVLNSPKLDFLIDDEHIKPVDPLFVAEIDPNDPNLDDLTWDGTTVKWILTKQNFQLDSNSPIYAELEITQLPHPPMTEHRTQVQRSKTREKYMIEAGNYGFYIYRNKRLISWADSLNTINLDQKLYGFRGRLFIESDADEVLNIDVTKSRIDLSELAKDQLSPILREAKMKSQSAWEKQTKFIESLSGNDPHDEINQALDELGKMNDESNNIDESVSPENERKILEFRRKIASVEKPATIEEKKKLEKERKRVQYVDSLSNNQLWERSFCADRGLIVRVNNSHRLVNDILSSCQENNQLVKILDLLFFCLAEAEYNVVYKETGFDQRLAENLLEVFREHASSSISDAIRKVGSEVLTSK
jgi:hypothetical protein